MGIIGDGEVRRFEGDGCESGGVWSGSGAGNVMQCNDGKRKAKIGRAHV